MFIILPRQQVTVRTINPSQFQNRTMAISVDSSLAKERHAILILTNQPTKRVSGFLVRLLSKKINRLDLSLLNGFLSPIWDSIDSFADAMKANNTGVGPNQFCS
jgi:hypothetical protein